MAEDVSYTLSIKEGDEDKATLEEKENGVYTFTALKDGQVTIIAISNQSPEVKDEEIITIQKKPDIESIKQVLCSKTYTHYSSELSFNNDGTAYLKLEGGGSYKFNWELSSNLYFSFSNIETLIVPKKWYDFRGTYGSTTDKTGDVVNLYVWDLDYSEAISLQFS